MLRSWDLGSDLVVAANLQCWGYSSIFSIWRIIITFDPNLNGERDEPISNSTWLLLTQNGLAIAEDSDRIIWSTPRLNLRLHCFNLMILAISLQKVSLWESFGYPTDTLVMGKRLAVGVEWDDLLAIFDGRSGIH
ncbi:hypothetical protein V6N13_120419 [Hibiscus sabdariffa]|uniref:Bulb-type lectin domain-containing protein n=1 Tax=Hibiscus sabdariffa TaxID=183260 RepID=A0ABR2E477_9ROSI